MTGRYARDTNVTVASSRIELEELLSKYGADRFGYVTDETGAVRIAFRIGGRHVRLDVPMPDLMAREFTHTPATDKLRSYDSRQRVLDQAKRQRWRALVLVVKAKLEASEIGISTIEREFMADTVMPDGRPVHEHVQPLVQLAYETGVMPPALLLLGAGE